MCGVLVCVMCVCGVYACVRWCVCGVYGGVCVCVCELLAHCTKHKVFAQMYDIL